MAKLTLAPLEAPELAVAPLDAAPLDAAPLDAVPLEAAPLAAAPLDAPEDDDAQEAAELPDALDAPLLAPADPLALVLPLAEPEDSPLSAELAPL